MGGCQNYGPFWGTLNIRRRIIIGIQKGTLILTTTHICCDMAGLRVRLGTGFEALGLQLGRGMLGLRVLRPIGC